ncbi:heat shock 70 kDa protein 4L-like [Limulus polyphemus]|uniref:Heat shock 70 kDa protein 4L-like n=1 Tax=Limulus polyphemus TaxID=6850 RepID=A0ABM1BUY6_LIMPO|nr:heat shock 70 kDa protein 4L-like [Limulus polyphemus]
MSVLGIDFGNENCYIAVARAGGIETIVNEYSQRITPSYVAFKENSRDLGVSAKNKHVTNVKNTLFGFKRLLGRKLRDPAVQRERTYLTYDMHELSNGDISVKTPTVDLGHYQIELGHSPHVLVPIALNYGFYKADLEDKAKNVVFVDIGHSATQVSACAFTKGQLKMLAATWDTSVGGRDFDNVLVRHFAEEFCTKYKINTMSSRKAVMRLLTESEKLKKQMSVNPHELPLNIECFMEDKDVVSKMTRNTFEELTADLLARLEETMKQVLQEAKLTPSDLDDVGIVGGSTRMPAIKRLIRKVFGREPSTTLNQDEAVARGCCLQCAMLSPTFKVREFSITDIQPYPIKVTWDASIKDDGEMEVFPKFHQVPFSKILTFCRSKPFTLQSSYSDKVNVSYPDSQIGTYTIQKVAPSIDGECAKVKVELKINIHGVFSVCSAGMVEKQTMDEDGQDESENLNDEINAPPNSEDMGFKKQATNDEAEKLVKHENHLRFYVDSEKKQPIQKKQKKFMKLLELPIDSSVSQLSRKELDDLIETEAKMVQQDRMEKEKVDAKNAVEEYVYDTRGQLCNKLQKFVSEQDRIVLIKLLEETENWLYDEGAKRPKKVYVEKLTELKKHCHPVIDRCHEFEERSSVIDQYFRSLQSTRNIVDQYAANDKQYAHIAAQEMEKVKNTVEQKQQWLDHQMSVLSQIPPHQNPPILASQIYHDLKTFDNKVTTILNIPKPKVDPPSEGKTCAGEGREPEASTDKTVENHQPASQENMDTN